jgi:hypothetical protein
MNWFFRDVDYLIVFQASKLPDNGCFAHFFRSGLGDFGLKNKKPRHSIFGVAGLGFSALVLKSLGIQHMC